MADASTKLLTDLKQGELVIVTEDDGTETETVVKYAPWKLGHGQWVVGLAGFSGGYSLSRVRRAK